jgi:hypothetical protein
MKQKKHHRLLFQFFVFQINKTMSTTDADSKRTERLARLKELHFRRVCIRQ